MSVAADLAAIVAPVLLCVAAGVLWVRLRAPFDSAMITSLVYNVGAPCLILSTFAKVDVTVGALGEVALAAAACLAVSGAVSALVLKAARLDLPSYLPALIFPLTGSMGLPVCFFGFGDKGLAFAIVYFTLSAVGTFTVGVALAAGSMSFGLVLRSPVVHAVAVAVALKILGVPLPGWLFNTVDLLGGIVIPMQLVALGVSLPDLRVGAMLRSSLLGCFRLVLGFAAGVGIAELFGLEGTARAVVVIQSAMPGAVSSYLFAQRFERRPEEVAGMVVVSTLVSFATLPVLLWFLLS